jgi:hypothetical protein
MKISPPLVAILVVVAAPPFSGIGQTESNSSENLSSPAKVESAPAPATSKLFYKPPADAGKIPTRVSGGARGEGIDTSLFALVPDHVAVTTKAQPSLFWFQSKSAKAKLELTLVEPKKSKPLLSLTTPQADQAGIRHVKLVKHKVELQPDVVYEWMVAIVPDPENRSKDVVAKGVIKRIKTPDDVANRIAGASETEQAAIYAQNGIWYDALEAITNAIEAQPDNAALREQRASLLRQIGAPEAAIADKK